MKRFPYYLCYLFFVNRVVCLVDESCNLHFQRRIFFLILIIVVDIKQLNAFIDNSVSQDSSSFHLTFSRQ